jgi:hypothetical protein
MAITQKFIDNLKIRLSKCKNKEIMDCYNEDRHDPDKFSLSFLAMRNERVNYEDIMNLTRDFAKVLGMEKQLRYAGMEIYFDIYEMKIELESLSQKLKEELRKYGIEIEFRDKNKKGF